MDSPFGNVIPSDKEGFKDGKLLLIDGDLICHTIAAAAENRSIKVKFKGSSSTKEFKTRTEFWGRSTKKIGGWLEEHNLERQEKGLSLLGKEDFSIEDLQEAEPLNHCLSSVKSHIRSLCDTLKTDNYKVLLGKGECFRHQILTPIKRRYKGNRDGLLKPIHFKAVQDYLISHHFGMWCIGREADDVLTELSYEDFISGENNVVVVTRDKDAAGNVGTLYNPDKMSKPKLIDGFGEIFLDDRKEVKGYGVKFQFAQIIGQDTADNYQASKTPDGVKWGYGHAKVFADLEPCESEKDCLELCVRKFKEWIPSPITYEAWDGSMETDDWLSWLQKHVDFAVMERYDGYRWDIKEMLDGQEIKY